MFNRGEGGWGGGGGGGCYRPIRCEEIVILMIT